MPSVPVAMLVAGRGLRKQTSTDHLTQFVLTPSSWPSHFLFPLIPISEGGEPESILSRGVWAIVLWDHPGEIGPQSHKSGKAVPTCRPSEGHNTHKRAKGLEKGHEVRPAQPHVVQCFTNVLLVEPFPLHIPHGHSTVQYFCSTRFWETCFSAQLKISLSLFTRGSSPRKLFHQMSPDSTSST